NETIPLRPQRGDIRSAERAGLAIPAAVDSGDGCGLAAAPCDQMHPDFRPTCEAACTHGEFPLLLARHDGLPFKTSQHILHWPQQGAVTQQCWWFRLLDISDLLEGL